MRDSCHGMNAVVVVGKAYVRLTVLAQRLSVLLVSLPTTAMLLQLLLLFTKEGQRALRDLSAMSLFACASMLHSRFSFVWLSAFYLLDHLSPIHLVGFTHEVGVSIASMVACCKGGDIFVARRICARPVAWRMR